MHFRNFDPTRPDPNRGSTRPVSIPAAAFNIPTIYMDDCKILLVRHNGLPGTARRVTAWFFVSEIKINA